MFVFRLSKPIEKKKKIASFRSFLSLSVFPFSKKKKKSKHSAQNRCNRGEKRKRGGGRQRAFDNTRVLRTSGWAGRALQSRYIVRVNRIVIVRVGGTFYVLSEGTRGFYSTCLLARSRSGFMCMTFYRRDGHVIEVQTGSDVSRPEEACSPPHFQQHNIPFLTLVSK